MENSELLKSFEIRCTRIAKAFSLYMWGEPLDEEDSYFISNDCTGTLEIGDTHWSLSDMYDVLKNKYPKDVVMAHYDYSVMYSGENREYYLNRGVFAKMYDGMPIEEWAKKHHEEVDKNRAYWESPEGKKRTEDAMRESVEKFKIDHLGFGSTGTPELTK